MPLQNHEASKASETLNEHQKRAILYGCLDLHRRMADMEAILAQSSIASPFSKYVNDLSPTETKVIQDYFARLRATLLTWLREADIPLDIQQTSTRWAVQCGMMFLQVTVAEMGPDRLSGYGPLTEAGRDLALRMRQDLDRLIDRVGAYLRQDLGRDLPQRLARLEATQAGAAALAVLDRIITRRGLVEFRPQLDQIVSRLENPRFEIAVFGRVNSGKSTLLNHLAGTDVLPVGVTPITAVPARLVRGDRAEAVISFAEMQPRTIDVGALREYASEEGNPGNHKHVTGILVRLPSPRLREGVVLVDTPGIGSLARSGGAETFAYLPHCDLGIVLIDAASALNPDDLGLLRLLYEAAVPAQVVLSKADLLNPEDRRRTVDYIRGQLRQELNLDLPVYPVSAVGAEEALLTHWFEQEIEPLLARHRALAETSLRRKIAHLRESVHATLETLLARQQGGAANGQARINDRSVRQLLMEADRAVREAQDRCRDWTSAESDLLDTLLDNAAQAIVSNSAGAGGTPIADAVKQVLAQRGQTAHELVAKLQQVLGRTLESLHHAAPLVHTEDSPVRNWTFRGLPAPEVPPWDAEHLIGPSWWGAVLPGLAVPATRRQLAARLGPALGEQLELHDRQVHAWLRGCLGQLIESYESQAEVFREQVQRRSEQGAAVAPVGEARDLEADLRELHQTEAIETPVAFTPRRGDNDSGDGVRHNRPGRSGDDDSYQDNLSR
jgi:GTP-binding protein EngB required for normal cell division/molybdenum-dependent DNA-binding transcriptional regulator ModE